MKRSQEEIISNILNVCSNASNKTKIVYKTNSNFHTTTQYLEKLIKNRLISTKEGPMTLYEVTFKGRAFLESYKQIQDALSYR